MMVPGYSGCARRTQRRTFYFYLSDCLALAKSGLCGAFFHTRRSGVLAGMADEECFAHCQSRKEYPMRENLQGVRPDVGGHSMEKIMVEGRTVLLL
jgi:hypothetical protein